MQWVENGNELLIVLAVCFPGMRMQSFKVFDDIATPIPDAGGPQSTSRPDNNHRPATLQTST